MQQMIEITRVTMKRLLNTQRVVENEAKAANRLQWMKMTLDTMRRAESARQKAAHISAIVAYSGCLFRLQNKIKPYRMIDDDYFLHNGLVDLMTALGIPINFINVDIPLDDHAACQAERKTSRNAKLISLNNG